MTMDLPSEPLWEKLSWFGIYKNKRQNNYKINLKVGIILALYFFTQGIVCATIRWEYMTLKFTALHDSNDGLYMLYCLLEMLLAPKNKLTLMDIVDKNYFKYNINFSVEKIEFLKKNEKQLNLTIKIISYGIFMYTCCDCVPPMFMYIFLWFTNNDGNNGITPPPLPYESWFPFNLWNKPLIYILIYLLYLFYGLGIYYPASAITVSSTAAVMHRLKTDIHLFCISIQEIDNIFENENSYNKVNIRHDLEDKLKQYQRNLIENHNLIIKNIRRGNEALALSALCVNQTACLLGCISLYMFLEVDEKISKFTNLVVFTAVLFIFFAYCINGQKIQNEDQELRNTLAQYNWINKPKWFKKAHLIMVLMANKSMEIKPYGLFVLNYDNFTNVTKAAYSYYSMLRTFKK